MTEYSVDAINKYLKTALSNVLPTQVVASGIWQVTKGAPNQVLCTTTPTFHSVTITCINGQVSAHLVGHDRMPPGGFEDRAINALSSTTAGCVYAAVTRTNTDELAAAGFYILAKE